MGAPNEEDVKVQTEDVSQETDETSSEAVEPETKTVVIATTDEDESSQEEPADGEPSTEQSEEEPKKEEEAKPDSSLKEETPTSNKFEERIKNFDEKVMAESRFAQDIMEASNTDPQLKLALTKALEKQGKLPAGSSELMEKSLFKPTEEKAEVVQEDERTLTPEQLFIRNLMKEQQEKEQKEMLRRESVLQDFETRHPDIAERENAYEVRNQIAVLERAYKMQGLSETEALEEAYNVLFNREALIEKAREKGKIEGQIQADVKSIASTPSGSSQSSVSTLRKLTKDEEVARKFLGMTHEEYLNHKDAMAAAEF